MDKKQKILVAIMIVIILACVALSIFIVYKHNKNKTENKDTGNFVVASELTKEETIDDIKISDISILKGDDVSSYIANVTNTKNEAKTVKTLYVNFYFVDTVFSSLLLENEELAANESRNIQLSIDRDLSQCYKITYSDHLLKNEELYEKTK